MVEKYCDDIEILESLKGIIIIEKYCDNGEIL